MCSVFCPVSRTGCARGPFAALHAFIFIRVHDGVDDIIYYKVSHIVYLCIQNHIGRRRNTKHETLAHNGSGTLYKYEGLGSPLILPPHLTTPNRRSHSFAGSLRRAERHHSNNNNNPSDDRRLRVHTAHKTISFLFVACNRQWIYVYNIYYISVFNEIKRVRPLYGRHTLSTGLGQSVIMVCTRNTR